MRSETLGAHFKVLLNETRLQVESNIQRINRGSGLIIRYPDEPLHPQLPGCLSMADRPPHLGSHTILTNVCVLFEMQQRVAAHSR